MSTPLTGDIKGRVEVAKRGVTLHNFPRVLDTAIAAKENIVNDKAQSGKTLGGQVMVVDNMTAPTKAAVYIAAGEAPADLWVVSTQVLGTGSSTVTPA